MMMMIVPEQCNVGYGGRLPGKYLTLHLHKIVHVTPLALAFLFNYHVWKTLF